MRNIYSHFTAFLLIVVLTLVGCEREEYPPCSDETNPLCPNYDPCLRYGEARSEFVIWSSPTTTADSAISMPLDTTRGGSLIFKGVYPTYKATYEWSVGEDPRSFNQPVLTLNFTGFNGTIQTRLVTTVEDEFGCLDAAERQDTAFRTLTVINSTQANIPLLGTFVGRVDQVPNRELILQIKRDTSINGFITTRMTGLNLDCPPIESSVGRNNGIQILADYSWFVTNHNPNGPRCRRLTAIGQLLPENRDILQVHYFYDDDSGKRRQEVFTGQRLR